MLDTQNDIGNIEKNISLSPRYRPPSSAKKQKFALLDPETSTYLLSDRQRLRELVEQVRQGGNEVEMRKLKRRQHSYAMVDNFFFYLAEQGYSTRLADITPEQIEIFINLKRSNEGDKYHYIHRDYMTELRAFFDRAFENKIITNNPFLPLIKQIQKLVPKNLSRQTQSDYQAFQEYLQHRVNLRLLSPGTAQTYERHLRTLLYDAEARHTNDLAYPIDLEGLFSNPRWIADWLINLENRSNQPSNELAQGSVIKYLDSIRYVWQFLKSQGRANKTFYNELKDIFRLYNNSLILPGRAPKLIEALSEDEQAAVLKAIENYSRNPILKLRDLALFITGIETTMRMESLHSMCLENYVELQPGVYAWRVKAKNSSKKGGPQQKQTQKSKWREWYLSPHARATIGDYLKVTQRDWSSRGPIWLNEHGRPLSLARQKGIIKYWLRLAECRITRPHVLRHTGIDRLISKFNLPIATVQVISQHESPETLLTVYARRAQIDAFKDINQLFPVEEENAAEYEKELLAIGTRLNEISAKIGRREQEQRVFTRDHVEELLDVLAKQITNLTKFLGYETRTEEIFLPEGEYLKIDEALQSLGLSYRQILDYEPEIQHQTLIKPTGRRPKSLLES